MVISLLTAISISYSVPQFEIMFKSFNTGLPQNTKNVLEYHYLGMTAPLLSIVALIYFYKSQLNQRSKNIVYALSMITFIITVSWHGYASELMYSSIMLMDTK